MVGCPARGVTSCKMSRKEYLKSFMYCLIKVTSKRQYQVILFAEYQIDDQFLNKYKILFQQTEEN